MTDSSNQSAERRKETRYDVWVTAMSSFGSFVDNKAMTREVSRNGMSLITSQVVPEGFNVELSFQLPGTSRPIFARGVVRWSDQREPTPSGEVPGFGVEFTEIDEKARLKIERFIRDRDNAGALAS